MTRDRTRVDICTRYLQRQLAEIHEILSNDQGLTCARHDNREVFHECCFLTKRASQKTHGDGPQCGVTGR